MGVRLSFIVPCLNSEATISDCLRSIFEQSLARSDYEVILVDNGSSDGTIEVAKAFPVRLIYEERPGASMARNAGIAAAQGEYLAFVDSDVTLESRWAEVLLQEMGSFFDGAQGRIVPVSLSTPRLDEKRWPKKWLDSYRYQMTSATTGGTFLNLKWFALLVPLVNTAGCIYRASLVRQVGGFNARLRRCEDNDLAEKVLSVGGALLGCEKVSAHVAFDGGVLSYLCRSFWIGFWRNRLNQAWKKPELASGMQFQRWESHGFNRMFWRLNGWLRQLGYFWSRYLTRKEPASSLLAISIAAQTSTPRKSFEIGQTRYLLAHSIRVIALSGKLLFANLKVGHESVLLQGDDASEILNYFQQKNAGLNPNSHQTEMIEALLSRGVLEKLNS